MFEIREGIYTIPDLGKRIDTRKGLSNQQLLELYEYKLFPFITITKKAIPFLKAEKLNANRIANLIMQAKTVEEVNLLLEVKTTKALKNIAETKISTLYL